MAGLPRSPKFSDSTARQAAGGRSGASARPLIQPYVSQSPRFDVSATRAATSMIVAGSIAIATGMGGLLWVGVQLLAHGIV
ncbi:MAG TPA: hypothetical protein VGG99_17575 [Acetobacteraceae bacterium]|jgi:hypothetical protein